MRDAAPPRISIVTPSVGPAAAIAGAVASVQEQGYPDVEHIVAHGGDAAAVTGILGRDPHVKVVAASGRTLAEALNRGFGVATGRIWGCLGPDEALVPGALHRVAREIDPGRGRHVVMGRCQVVDGQGRFVGIEHPSRFDGPRRLLEVWNGLGVPPAALFWTPEVWARCGPLDARLTEPASAHYDLCCRFSRRYPFHVVDEVLARARLSPAAGAAPWADAARLEERIRLSRRHWGSPLHPSYWRLALSLATYRFDRVGRARRWIRQAREHRLRGRPGRAVPGLVGAAAVAPEVAFVLAIYPGLRRRAAGALHRALARLTRPEGPAPETAVYLERVEAWDDGWVGPRLALSREVGGGAGVLSVRGWVDLTYLAQPFVLTVRVAGQDIGRIRVERSGDFAADLPLGGVPAGRHTVEIEASAWFVPHRVLRNRDFRPVAWRLSGVDVLGATCP